MQLAPQISPDPRRLTRLVVTNTKSKLHLFHCQTSIGKAAACHHPLAGQVDVYVIARGELERTVNALQSNFNNPYVKPYSMNLSPQSNEHSKHNGLKYCDLEP
jgi:hypothetical protein